MELLCFHAFEIPSGATPPTEIMFAPAGEHEIKAGYNGKAQKVKVNVDAAAAERLQRDLTARLASPKSKPFFDFHHDAGDASGYPTAFRWEEGKGIMAAVKWSPKGTEAITCGKDQLPTVRYFSPRVNFDAATHTILGLMPSEDGNAAGGIVSDPAFENISALLAAKHAAQAASDQTTNETEMSKELLASIATSGLLTAQELQDPKAHELLASKLQELKDKANKPAAPAADGTEVEALRKELLASKTREAKSFVTRLKHDGKIPMAAELLAAKWEKDYIADPDGTIAAAKELKAAKALDPNPLTDDNDDTGTGENAQSGVELSAAKTFYAGVAARQSALCQANPGLNPHQAWQQAEGELKAARATARA